MKIAIIGCGWVGKRLAGYLMGKGHHVIATTTSPEKIPELQEVAAEVHLLDFSTDYSSDVLNPAEVLIFSVPISRDSWHKGFRKVKTTPHKTILFSSTGIYPQEIGIYTESYDGPLRNDILAAEQTVLEKYPQTTILRFGGLMGDERVLQHFFSTKKVPYTDKKVNYIHYDDILLIVELLLTADSVNRVYNMVAPEHPTIGEILKINTEEGKAHSEKNGDRIISSDLLIQDFNYTFIHPNPKYFST